MSSALQGKLDAESGSAAWAVQDPANQVPQFPIVFYDQYGTGHAAPSHRSEHTHGGTAGVGPNDPRTGPNSPASALCCTQMVYPYGYTSVEVSLMREVDQATFVAAHDDGAVVIDVREPDEYVAGHVPGADLVPLSRLASHVSQLPRGAPVYVICASGNRSLAAADFLGRAGVDAWSVAGGTSAWARAGRTVVYGRHAHA